MNRVKRVEVTRCPMCARPSAYGVTHPGCRRRWGMDGVVTALAYWGVVRRMVGKLKYRRVRGIYPVLVEAMVSVGEMTALEGKEMVVVAVPLHRRRLRDRGFNQAELLTRAVAEYFGWEVGEEWLVRKRMTRPQMELKRKERLTNVKGAFSLNPKFKTLNSKRRKSYLLVDDVWTTGATMRECAKVLKRAGAGEVWGLVVAA